MADHSYILIIIGWSTVIIEMLYPVFIWIPKTQKTWMMLTISMHLGIALVLNLYYFSAIMIIWNLTNFNFEKETVIMKSPDFDRRFNKKSSPIGIQKKLFPG
jgi:hypothetical protein